MNYFASVLFRLLSSLLALSLLGATASASSETWVEYYRVGAVLPGGTQWTKHELDTDSLARNGRLIVYKIRLNHPEEGPVGVTDMRTDCESGTRGELASESMYATYRGTIGGQEVAMVCALAGGRGLLK